MTLYYLLSLKHGPIGNCARWWGPDQQGYVCDLNNAGLYSRDEAVRLEDKYDTFKVSETEARDLSAAHVDFDRVCEYWLKAELGLQFRRRRP